MQTVETLDRTGQEHYHLLIVEDNPGDVELAKENLSIVPGKTFQISQAANLKEALDLLQTIKIDAVVLDLNLPDSSGLQTLLKIHEHNKHLAIMIMSSSASEEMIATALRHGAQDYIDKNSYSPEMLARSILYAIERNKSQVRHLQIEKLVTTNPDAVVVLDQEGNVLFSNKAAEDLLGKPHRELVREGFGFDLKEGETSEIEIQNEDEKKIAEARTVAFDWLETDALLVLLRDVTEKKKMEAQLRQSHKMQALGTFAGGIAHDFNNITAAIVGNADLLKDEIGLSLESRRHIEEILKAGIRARELVGQILNFSRMQDTKKEPVVMKAVIDDAIQTLQSRVPPSVEIRVHVQEQLPSIMGNSTQLHQILLNMIVNSSHAIGTRPGWIAISAENVEIGEENAPTHVELRKGNYVCLAVEDNGCGIDEAVLDRIFDPFFTTKQVGSGTGLGLSVVHGILQVHDGAITVDSRLGEGTLFKLYFPALQTALTLDDQKDLRQPSGHGQNILYVDDDEALAYLMPLRLKRLGYTVIAYTDAREAVQRFRENPNAFDMIVTDLNMPGITGFEVVEQVLETRPSVPCIITSGYIRNEDVDKAREIGAQNLIIKPVDLNEIATAIHQAFEKARTVA